MTREDAKAILEDCLYKAEYKHGAYGIALKMAIKALEQEPKTDTWSIKDVADTFKKHGLIREQEPTTGHWIEHPEIETSTPEYLMFYECSECGDRQCFCKSDIYKKRFCGNCGCRMIEPQENEDKNKV